MNFIKNLTAISVFAFLALCVPSIASAQYGNGGYYPNGNSGNGGYYGGGDMRGTLQDLKSRAKEFDRMVGQNGGGIFGSRGTNGDLKRLSDQFKSATSRLEDKYGRGRNLNNSYNEASEVLSIGSEINNSIGGGGRGRNGGGGSYLQGEWGQINSELGAVANTYGMGYNNRGNRGGQNGNYGNRGNYPNGNYPNGNYPNGNYPNGNYPNGNYPNGNYPNGNYPNGNYPNGNYPNGNYPNNYPNNNGGWRSHIPFPLPF